METHGLPRRDFEWLVKYQVLSPMSRLKAWSTLIVATLLLASLAANISSPIITGAISWVPMNKLAHGLPISHLFFSDIEEGISSDGREAYMSEEYFRGGTVVNAAGLVNTGWGRDPEEGIYKRISPQVQALANNSTIENVTMPYLQVHSLEWIKDPNDIPDFKDHKEDLIDVLYSRLRSLSPSVSPWKPGWFTLLVPNTATNWSDDPIKSISITDKRLLVCQYWSGSSPSNITQGITPRPPADAYLVRGSTGISTMHWRGNNSRLELGPHPLTFQALELAPAVSLHLESLNSSIPFPWQDTEAYIKALLVRSYSGAWNILTEFMRTNETQVNYVPSFPGLVATIEMWRVHAWLGLQLLVTILSIIFLIIEYDQSRITLIIDASLTPFFLDTNQVRKEDNTDPLMNGTLKIQEEDDVLRIWKQDVGKPRK
ncbi:hypothetical protein RSOLAG22IIIB_04970 [Rhizoctonia solani]|uniref:Transmembrane protein n=1 Tax=Rhizoctonia solani TaxID=456999 RepID=A0A0K6G2B0_9AGAM|nr:hypothetical protein RSOLAG22IIIB_04970 [Rhizoctonia solani]